MRYLLNHLSSWTAILAWLAGVVLVKGAWLTLAAIFFPPYAWYVVMEKLIT